MTLALLGLTLNITPISLHTRSTSHLWNLVYIVVSQAFCVWLSKLHWWVHTSFLTQVIVWQPFSYYGRLFLSLGRSDTKYKSNLRFHMFYLYTKIHFNTLFLSFHFETRNPSNDVPHSYKQFKTLVKNHATYLSIKSHKSIKCDYEYNFNIKYK